MMASSEMRPSIPAFLICPVCSQMFSDPKRLPCSHSYCQHCISQLLTPEGSTIKCRQCRSQHHLSSQSVQDLPDNNLLKDLLEFSDIMAKSCLRLTSDGLLACYQCPDTTEPNVAERFCRNCKNMMCNVCNKKHKKGDKTKYHKVEVLDDIAKLFMCHSSKEQLMTEYCKVHSRKKLKYFCSTCKMTICRVCKEKDHLTNKQETTHKIFEIKEANEKEREKLRKGIKKMKKRKPAIEKFRHTLSTLNEQLDQDRERAAEELNGQVKKIIDLIHEKESALLEELNSKHRADKELIKSHMNHSENVLSDLSRCIDFTSRVLKEENEVDFLAVSGPATDTIREMLDEKFAKSTSSSGVCLEFARNSQLETLLHCEPIGALHKTMMLSFLTPRTAKQQSPSSSSDTVSFSLVETIGRSGKGNGEMASPHGLTVTPEGAVVVADRFNNRVQILEGNGDYKNHFELENLSRRFDPVDVAALDSKRVAITDANNKNIHIIDIVDSAATETTAATVSTTSSCDQPYKHIASFGNSQILNPKGICVDESGKVFVADCNTIKVISSNGSVEKIIGSHQRSKEPGQFDDIWCITTNNKGQLLVCDTGNQRVQLLDSDGNFLMQFGEKDDPFNTPRGVAVDKSDNIFITSNHCVQMFSSDGKLICRVDDESDKLQWPCGIVVVENEMLTKVFVADAGNHCIRVYQGSKC